MAKKAAPKRTTTRKRVIKKQPTRSFRVSKDNKPFMSVGFGRETVYWLILGAVVILFSLWIANLQAEINQIYDHINQSEIELGASEHIEASQNTTKQNSAAQ